MRVFGLLAVAAAALAAVQLVSPSVRAQVNVEVDAAPAEGAPVEEGTMIQIGPDGAVDVDVNVDGDRAARLRERMLQRRAARQGAAELTGRIEISPYWIGVGGEPLPDSLRAQIDVPDNEGVLIGTVDPDGPAGKAGVHRFDILLRANDRPMWSVAALAVLVDQQGQAGAPISMELLRRGKVVVVEVTPAERPIETTVVAPQRRARPGLFQNFNGIFRPEGALRGEGEFAGGGFGEMLQGMPMALGVSVSVVSQGDGPAQVTVTQGEKTWTFDEGDEDAIAKLPGDVRPMVERMLQQQGGVFEPGFEGFSLDVPGFQMQLNGEGAAARMRAMEQRMRALQNRLGGPPAGPAAPAIEPQENLDEAPAFVPAEPTPPEAEGPTELEIPAKPE